MVAHTTARNTSSTAMELHGFLRYYSPEKAEEKGIRWPQPPHVYFASLQLDWKSLLAFDKRFGVLLREHWRLTPELQETLERAPNLTAAEREQWSVSQKHEIAIYDADVELAKDMQRLLQAAWRGDVAARERLQFGVGHHAHQEAYGPIQIKPVPTRSGVDIFVHDQWSYIRIAFLADQERARVCANPDCPAPYFLAKRKDKRVCGQPECGQWAQRQFALKYWHDRGDKLRRAARKGRSRR